jgi:hypothetical protein
MGFNLPRRIKKSVVLRTYYKQFTTAQAFYPLQRKRVSQGMLVPVCLIHPHFRACHALGENCRHAWRGAAVIQVAGEAPYPEPLRCGRLWPHLSVQNEDQSVHALAQYLCAAFRKLESACGLVLPSMVGVVCGDGSMSG